ncbi:MAG: type II toxin-antitoxin system prevent-host-death family antitoxin [Rhodospirillales bacterium]|nr:type II toxin-antitoxin system prevent-host-death family antitoxin [Rhodospirillales bacterium]
MKISVTEAKAQLTELVRRAEAGEEVLLTRFGQGVVRLVAVAARPSAAERRALMEEVRRVGRAKAKPGPPAARSQDFLYDRAGLSK